MKVDDLFKAYQKAQEKADEAEQRETEAKLKKIKTRVAADRADREHQTAFDLYVTAVNASTEAYNTWVSARNAALEEERT